MNTEATSDDAPAVLFVRLPRALHEQVKDMAHANRMSVNRLVVRLIESAAKAREGKDAPCE